MSSIHPPLLSRILEPEVMDTPDEARDYDDMDHSQVNQTFVDDLLQHELGEFVLDLGTGTAQIPVRLCKSHPSCRVLAVDLAIEMLELARYNIEVAGQILRIELQHIDAKQMPYPKDSFTAVISNSIVHHIPEPTLVLKEAVRVVRPGGLLFFRDLTRPSDHAELEGLVAKYAGEANEHQRKMFANSLHAALSLDEIQTLVEQLGFKRSTVAMTSDRHWTWVATK